MSSEGVHRWGLCRVQSSHGDKNTAKVYIPSDNMQKGGLRLSRQRPANDAPAGLGSSDLLTYTLKT